MVFGCLSSFCFLLTPDTSRVPTEAREHEARRRGNFDAPGFGSSAGCYSPWLPGERGTPLAPGGLGRLHCQPPAGPAGQQLRGTARLHGKERTGPRAHAACNQRVSRRTLGVSCGAHPARFAARKRCVVRRAPGAFSGAQPVRLTTRTRRVFRRAPSASCGAQSARLCGVGSICLHSEPVFFDSGFVAVIYFRLGNVCAQSQGVSSGREELFVPGC